MILLGLNPCSNGRYSQRIQILLLWLELLSLNPCFNGRYSQSQRLHSNEQRGEVLILVLMEDSLREFGNVLKIILLSVLILVLMEDTFRVI